MEMLVALLFMSLLMAGLASCSKLLGVAGGSRASRMRSSAAASAWGRCSAMACSRAMLTAASVSSRMMESTSLPT